MYPDALTASDGFPIGAESTNVPFVPVVILVVETVTIAPAMGFPVEESMTVPLKIPFVGTCLKVWGMVSCAPSMGTSPVASVPDWGLSAAEPSAVGFG
jgi:hypothetical protein